MTFPVIKNILRRRTNQIAGRAVTEAAADCVQTRSLHDVHLWSHRRRLSPTLVKNSEEDRQMGVGGVRGSEAAGDFYRVSTWGRHEKVSF